MQSTNGRSRESGLPRELKSAERPVRLKASGVFVLSCVAGLLAAALWLPVVLYTRAKEDEGRARELAAAAAKTEAEVFQVGRSRGENSKVRITYRYAVNGREYSSQMSVRGREAGRFPIGSRVPVQYLISDPGNSWVSGKLPRPIPVWLILLIPPVLLPIAGVPLLLIRRQAHLLSEGRATMATVKKAEKASEGESTAWRVTYEWTLLSGAKRSSRYDVAGKTPAPGTAIPILYDRDNPQRHARYPLSLVHIPGAPRRNASHGKSRRRHAAWYSWVAGLTLSFLCTVWLDFSISKTRATPMYAARPRLPAADTQTFTDGHCSIAFLVPVTNQAIEATVVRRPSGRRLGFVAQADLWGVMRSTNLDEPVTRSKSLQHIRPQLLEHVEKKCTATVADPHPDKPCVRAVQDHMRKILVFRHEDKSMRGGVRPHFRVRGIPQAHISYVLGFAAEFSIDEARQRGRKLIIYEESHADSRTG